MFGNVPRALWSKWFEPDAENRIELACRALLVENPEGRRVLFETGIGAFFPPKLRDRYGVYEPEHVLLRSLAGLGLSDADIDYVVLSHMHFDHAGGLLGTFTPDAPAQLLFPNAHYLVGRDAWERMRHPHARDRASFIPGLAELLRDSGRLALVDGERAPSLGAAVRFSYTEGHTPGLMHAEIGEAAGVVFCSDLIPGRAWVHLPVTMGYDRYPERLIDEKRAFLERALERGNRLFFTHDPLCALADVTRDERGRFSTRNERSAIEALVL